MDAANTWQLEVFNVLGQQLAGSAITGSYTFDTSTLTPGVYFLRLSRAGESLVRKFVKQ